MTPEQLDEIDRRVVLLRKECYEVIKESADEKPAFTLLRVYSKLKMFCEFYTTTRQPPMTEAMTIAKRRAAEIGKR